MIIGIRFDTIHVFYLSAYLMHLQLKDTSFFVEHTHLEIWSGFFCNFFSCLFKFSLAFVVYISFIIPSGYLKYVDSSTQLFFQELIHIGYFYPIFLQRFLDLLGLSLLWILYYTVFKSFINFLISLYGTYFVEFLIWWIMYFCISVCVYDTSIAWLKPNKLSFETISISSRPPSFS